MIKYIVKRLAMGVVTMFFLITITFWLTRLMPGSPFATDNISPSVLATLEANYGFDKPIDQQFVIYLQSLLQGNLGVSYTRTGVTVNDLIAQGFPVTLKLGLISFAIALVIGTVIGIWMSTTKSSAVKGWLITGSTLFISIPGFVLAIVLLMVFGQGLKVLPVLFDGSFLSYIMPVLALAVYPIAQISRLVHASYTEAMNQDYVVMAGQGPGQAAHPVPAHPEERHAAAHHGVRPDGGLPDHRQLRGGEHLHHPGNRRRIRQLREQPRLHRDHGPHDFPRGRHHHCELDQRPGLCPCRSAHQA